LTFTLCRQTAAQPKGLRSIQAGIFHLSFSADDKTVYFSSRRHDVASSVRFPEDGYFTKLYKAPAKGGRSLLVNSAGTEFVHFDKAGDKFIYQDSKVMKTHTASTIHQRNPRYLDLHIKPILILKYQLTKVKTVSLSGAPAARFII